MEYEVRKQEYFESLFSFDFEHREMIQKRKEAKEKEIREKFNMTVEDYLNSLKTKLAEKKALLESYRPKLADGEKRVDKATGFFWVILNCSFTVGGMIGTLGSKFLMDLMGRKKGIFVHHIVGMSGAVLVLISFYVYSPVCLLVSRFLFGLQGGMNILLNLGS
jgi:uncharacterized membrane protein YeaQ/YmgE (transglycosylase-associated protein family)